MNETSNIVRLRQPDEIDDPLTDVLRSGARRLLAQAIEMEAEAFLAAMKDLKLADGRDRDCPAWSRPGAEIQTGIGPVHVSRVKIRDRGATGEGGPDPVHLVDPAAMGAADARAWMRSCRFSTCAAFRRAISRRRWRRLLGKDAPNLSPR